MPLYPLPWQDPASVRGQERRSMLSELGSRLRMAQERLADLRRHDPNGLLPGAEAVVADMLALKAELEPLGFVYTIPDHLKDRYDENFAPVAPLCPDSPDGKHHVAPIGSDEEWMPSKAPCYYCGENQAT